METKKIDYNTPEAWHKYKELYCHKIDRPLTPEEEDFCRVMYHYEEFRCGLDG